MPTPAEIIPIVAPELVGNAQLAGAIGLAEEQVSVRHCRRSLAVAYLAAHTLTLAQRGGRGGAVASETEGSLSRSFSSTSSEGLSQTAYGKELERLNRQCFGLAARTGWLRG